LFFIAWATIESILNADRALHFDLFEAYAWGQEFQLGYHQHGPFWAWVAGAWFLLFPNTNTSFVILEALNATLGLLGASKLIGLFARGWQRHAATLLLLATPFYTFNAYKYNANTIFVSLWPWTLYFFVRSLDRMSKWDALFFGVFAAACILSKYYAVLLLAACTLAIAFHHNGPKYVRSALPWITAAAFSALVAPHLVWALNTNAPPVAYAMGLTGRGWLFSVRHAAIFVLELAAYQAGPAAILVFARVISRNSSASGHVRRLTRSRRNFLAVLVLAPPLLTVAAGLVLELKIESIMAIGIFPLAPLFLMQWVKPLDMKRGFSLAAGAAVAITLITLVLAPIARATMTAKKTGPSYTFPYRELAASVTELWRAETHTPLRYIGGYAANGLAFYSEDRPSSFTNLDYGRALWVTPDKLKQRGLIIACAHDDSVCLNKAAAFLWGNWKQKAITIGRQIGSRRMPEVAFDVFVVPPTAG
jgi:4-amino-4-deoxy-L-arabinose transferase-like glycosyltransferase